MNNKIEIKKLEVIKPLQDEFNRYFIISIKKLFSKHKDHIEQIDFEENLIKNKIKFILDSDTNFDNYDKIIKLNEELQELEIRRFNISYNTLSFKAINFFSDKYEKEYDINTIKYNVNKSIEKFKNLKFTSSSFKKYHNIANKKYYAKKIENNENRKVMNNSEKASYLAELKRNKAINIIKECLEILKNNNEKTTANNVKKIIDEKFESCLAIRQIKTYLKDLKNLK